MINSAYNGRVLHRDINARDIIIYNGGGLLIDWDMSKDLDWRSDDSRVVGYVSRILDCRAYSLFGYFQGTWAFQSLRLARLPKHNVVLGAHDRLDDLESFYHVLFWISIQHARNGLVPEWVYDTSDKAFDDAVIVENQAYAGYGKELHMISKQILKSVQFKNPPLLKLLLKISVKFSPLYISPPRLTGSEAKKAQQAGDSYRTALQTYKEDLDFLNTY